MIEQRMGSLRGLRAASSGTSFLATSTGPDQGFQSYQVHRVGLPYRPHSSQRLECGRAPQTCRLEHTDRRRCILYSRSIRRSPSRTSCLPCPFVSQPQDRLEHTVSMPCSSRVCVCADLESARDRFYPRRGRSR